MGFNISDIVMKIKKGFVQFDVPYYNVTERDEAFCSVFEAALQKGPMTIFNQMNAQFQQMTNMAGKVLPSVPGLSGMAGIPGMNSIPGLGHLLG